MSSIRWIDNPLELLSTSIKFFCTNIDGHCKLSLICIDNSLEIGLKTYVKHYLESPIIKLENGKTISPKKAKLWQMLKFLERKNLINDDFVKLANYNHEIRNNLYHEGSTIPRRKDISNYIVKVIKTFENLFEIHFTTIKDEDQELSFLIEYINFIHMKEKDLNIYSEDHRFQNIQSIVERIIPPSIELEPELYITGIDQLVELQNE